MKQILLRCCSLFILLMILTAAKPTTNSTAPPKGKLFEEGCVLVYFVESWPDQYLFTIRITENNKKSFGFHYIFTNDKLQGDITMDQDALENAMKMYNFFDGKDHNFSDQTSVVMSKKGYNLLAEGKEATFDMGNEKMITFKKSSENPIDTFETAIHSKYGKEYLMALIAEDEEGENIIAVHNNPDFPIILGDRKSTRLNSSHYS